MPDSAAPTPLGPALVRARALEQGLTYGAYLAAWDVKRETPLTGLDADARRYVLFAKYNHERSERVHEAYRVDHRLARALDRLPDGQTWVVLTEDWCGDSAFVLPVIADAAARTAAVTLRILPRDAHLDVMDGYLTNGGRAIPKLVAFDEHGREAWTYGPRPRPAVAHRQTLVDAGLDHAGVISGLVAWYEDGGWRTVEDELAACVESQLGA